MNEHESADKKLHSRLQKKKLDAQSEPGAGDLLSAAGAFTASLSQIQYFLCKSECVKY